MRHLQYKGQDVALQSESKGYRFKLTPPVPVKVLDGEVRGNAKSVKHMVPRRRGSVDRRSHAKSHSKSAGVVDQRGLSLKPQSNPPGDAFEMPLRRRH